MHSGIGLPGRERAVDSAADLGVDALILADIGVMDYAAGRWPELPLHLSVQASGTNYEALRFYHELSDIRRAVLPRVLSLAQVRHIVENSPVAIEVFGFASLRPHPGTGRRDRFEPFGGRQRLRVPPTGAGHGPGHRRHDL